MTTPLWDELAEIADRHISTLSKCELMTLRSAAIQMENWFFANQEAFEEIDALTKERNADRAMMIELGTHLEAFSKKAREAAFHFSPDVFARDYTSHINLMGGLHKDPDYMRGENSCRHVDLRETKPRAKAVK
jgi:hypothetical protein